MARILRIAAVGIASLLCVPAPSGAADADEAVRSITAALRSGQFQQALDLARAAERTLPQDVRLLVLEGMALTRLGKDGEGLAIVRKALALSPDFVPALEAA